MALFRVNATREGTLLSACAQGDWRVALHRALDAIPRGAPVCVLIHGFRFTWRREVGAGCHCPHERLYRGEAVAPSPRRRPHLAAWPTALGYAGDSPAEGLCICLGWDARLSAANLSLRTRRDFAEVYRGARVAGGALADLLGEIAARRPGLPVDILGHSLGARVALAAAAEAPGRPFGRLLLLGAAAFASEAREAVARLDAAGGGAEIYHFLSRANDLYDALFRAAAPAPEMPGDPPLGVAGLGRRHPRWLDLQLDHSAMRAWLEARGCALERAPERLSHWHFYADPGAMAFYRAILRERGAHGIGALRRARIPEEIEPRWSRLSPCLPRLRAPRPAGTDAVAALTES